MVYKKYSFYSTCTGHAKNSIEAYHFNQFCNGGCDFARMFKDLYKSTRHLKILSVFKLAVDTVTEWMFYPVGLPPDMEEFIQSVLRRAVLRKFERNVTWRNSKMQPNGIL